MTASGHDATASGAVTRQARKLRWGAVGVVLFMLGITALLWTQLPTSVARAFGTATEVTAVVDDVQLSDDQPRKKRNGPLWVVSVQWTSPDAFTFRRGEARVKSDDAPFAVGVRVTVFVIDDSDRVLLAPGTDEAVSVWLVLGAVAVSFVVAGLMFRQARKWKRLVDVPAARGPGRVRILELRPRYGKPTVVDFTPVGSVRFAGSFRLYGQPPFVLPRVGEELEIWSLGEDGTGPLLVRQPDEGTYWGASGWVH